MLTRRSAGKLIAGAAASTTLIGAGFRPALAADKVIKIGIDLPLTGADAQSAARIKYGALLAIQQANDAGTLKGYKLVPVVLNDATATAGQYDPAQAATNARAFVADPQVMAAIGPQMSGAGKAMAPILSEGDLATITPSSTNPDITDPKFAAEFDPSGKAVYFRTVTTDAYQGPAMANYFSDILKVKSVYVLDDSGAYGVGIADTFQARAKEKGMQVLGRDRLDPKEADYTVILTKIKALNPGGLYYGGVMLAGTKLVKQAYNVLPAAMPKAGGDGLYDPEMLTAVGFPAAEGWYCSIAAPHLNEDPKVQPFVQLYESTFKTQPDDYAITAYDAGLVIVNAIKGLIDAGKPVTRGAVRDAIQNSSTNTLQGTVQFDKYGDIVNRTVSIFQVVKNTAYKLDDIVHQFKYIGVAPTS
ncbi:MAG TPA: branched-chain amino acid ABC transporter substrate-binding protein [Acetobacteraceae bacterium]|jgi:branched-chain amino acid transport system substrate-binding protein|nr:branched-chain amino acid ABC transporter substrate-binding protein [Acetobacteraceae bacterium]